MKGLEKSLGYRFKSKSFLKEALTHKSFYHENLSEEGFYNERLEFLGDTVLGLIIAEFLYRQSPPLLESEMAKIKSYLVSGKVLSHIADEINLGEYIILGKGEIGTGGRKKASILADTLEALFGAIFVESGFKGARKAILKIYEEKIEETVKNRKYLDYKTELQEISQNDYGVLPVYKVISEEGLEHKKKFIVEVSIHGEVFGAGIGSSKKKAEIAAAKEAFNKINPAV